MKTFLKIVLGCACLGLLFLSSGCATVASSTATTSRIPEGVTWNMLAEVHNNPSGPTHALIRGHYLFKYEDLKSGNMVIIRKDDGSTAIATYGQPNVTPESYVAKAGGMYAPIGSDPIPDSYWGDAVMRLPGTARVLVVTEGRSMLPTIPEKAIVAVILGHPYGQLRTGQPVVFWNPESKGFTVHSLVAQFGDRWVTQGVNNPSLPRAVSVSVSYGQITTRTWMQNGPDPYPMTPHTYVGAVGKVWKNLTL